jgi:hypothetical protein
LDYNLISEFKGTFMTDHQNDQNDQDKDSTRVPDDTDLVDVNLDGVTFQDDNDNSQN